MPSINQNLNKARLTLLVGLLFTTLAAGIFRTPPILLMAGVLLAIFPLGLLVGWVGSRRLALTRVLPDSGQSGDVLEGIITLRNRSRWPSFLVTAWCGRAEESTPHSSGGTPDALPDTDAALVVLGSEERMFPLLAREASISWRQQWLLRRRGVFRLKPACAGTLDPLGLYTAIGARTAVQEILVVPRPVRLERLGLLEGVTSGMAIPRHASVVADAMDFHGVRPWVPGEGIRRISWKSTARTQQLHVIDREENIASDLTILLDTQASSIAGQGPDNTLETAITIIASVADYLLENGYVLELYCWQPAASEFAARHSAGEFAALHLLRHQAGSTAEMNATLRLLAHLQSVASPEATLPHLVQHTLPLLPAGRRTLLLASSRADLQGALNLAGNDPSGQGLAQAIVFDAHSFSAPEDAAPDSTPHRIKERSRFSPGVRVMRHGDPLAAVLERSL